MWLYFLKLYFGSVPVTARAQYLWTLQVPQHHHLQMGIWQIEIILRFYDIVSDNIICTHGSMADLAFVARG